MDWLYVVSKIPKGLETLLLLSYSKLKMFAWCPLLTIDQPIAPTGEHITDTYITETDTAELENLSHNIIDIFIIET